MKILFAASEATPFVKTGGLADVLGSLPQAIQSRLQKEKQKGSQVAVVLPKYSLIEESSFSFKPLTGKILVPVGDRIETGTIWTLDPSKRASHSTPRPPHPPHPPHPQLKNLSVYFIENRKYFNRSALYRTEKGDFDDNDERFIFFSRAVLELCKFIDFVPDIIHCHDWQTGLIPAYLKTLYHTDAFFHRTATVFTIHNIAYQGLFPKQTLFLAGFNWHDFTPEKLEYYEQINFLKAALVFADKISTVSPTYSQEVREKSEFGRGMEGVLKARSKDFFGILNGLDRSEWDPAKDSNLLARFSQKSKNLIATKKICKKNLQKTLQFSLNESVPLVGMVSRLDPQKGFGRVIEVVQELLHHGEKFQWVILGSGDKEIQELLTNLSKQFSKQISFQTGFNNKLAHKIYGGSDLFFMPSEFEPCGLGQMIAMRYGTIPVVSPTGGLLDTVFPWDQKTGKGTGFVSAENSASSLLESLQNSFKIYQNSVQWEKLVQNAMAQDFSWELSAGHYLELYKAALDDRTF